MEIAVIKILGFILITDGALSLFLPRDKQFLWQVGRVIRICIGIYLFIFYRGII